MTCRPLNYHSRYVSPVVILVGGGGSRLPLKMVIIFDSCVNAGASFVGTERWEKEEIMEEDYSSSFHNSIWRLRSNSKILEKKKK